MSHVPTKLAPLDHIRNLYKDAEALLPKGRAITRKQDIIRAVHTQLPVGNAGSAVAHAVDTILSSGPVIIDTASSAERTIAELEGQVYYQAKRYNELKRVADAKQRKFEELKVRNSGLEKCPP
jgi:hypothetical protein